MQRENIHNTNCSVRMTSHTHFICLHLWYMASRLSLMKIRIPRRKTEAEPRAAEGTLLSKTIKKQPYELRAHKAVALIKILRYI